MCLPLFNRSLSLLPPLSSRFGRISRHNLLPNPHSSPFSFSFESVSVHRATFFRENARETLLVVIIIVLWKMYCLAKRVAKSKASTIHFLRATYLKFAKEQFFNSIYRDLPEKLN